MLISSKYGSLINSVSSYIIDINDFKDYLLEHEYQHPLSERKLRYPKAPIDIQEKRTRSKSVDAIEKRRVDNQYSSNKADSFQSSDNNGQDIPLPISLVDSIDDYIFPEEY